MSTETHGHYYCAKCDKHVEANLFSAGQYRIGKHLSVYHGSGIARDIADVAKELLDVALEK